MQLEWPVFEPEGSKGGGALMFSDHNDRVAHSTSWDDPPEDYRCPSYWELKGVKFPCDLEEGHSGPHVNYPKKRGHDAIIIWSVSGEGF